MTKLSESQFKNNAFFILGASSRDSKNKLIELADEKSLELDDSLVSKARSDLTNPRTRIFQELSWFPGVSPRTISKLFQDVSSLDDLIRLSEIDLGSKLANANLTAAIFEFIDDSYGESKFLELLTSFAENIENIDLEDELQLINEERLASGFPEISDVGQLEDAYTERLNVFKTVVMNAVDRLPYDRLIKLMADLVEQETGFGYVLAGDFIYSLVDSYEIQTKSFLEKELDSIEKLGKKVIQLVGSPQELNASITELLSVLNKFYGVAKPIQISYHSKGMEHDITIAAGKAVRSVAINLYNNHNLLDQSLKITSALKSIFEDSHEFAEMVQKDEETLNSFVSDRAKKEQDKKNFLKEMSFSAEIGLVFKEVLSISERGVYYGSKGFPTDQITRIGWGSFTQRVNGISTGTNYRISFGNNSSVVHVDTKREKVYDEFTDKLWRLTASNIIGNIAEQLKLGRPVYFKNMTLWDDRISLKLHKLFGSEAVIVPLREVVTSSYNGELTVSSIKNSKVYDSMSYYSDLNTSILGTIINLVTKASASSVSEALG